MQKAFEDPMDFPEADNAPDCIYELQSKLLQGGYIGD